MKSSPEISKTSALIKIPNFGKTRAFYEGIPGISIANSADQLLCLEMPDGMHITLIPGVRVTSSIEFFCPLGADAWSQLARADCPEIQKGGDYISLLDPGGIQMVFYRLAKS